MSPSLRTENGSPGLASSSLVSTPLLNRAYHLNIRARDKQLSPYTCLIISTVSAAVFPGLKKYLMFVLCSMPLLSSKTSVWNYHYSLHSNLEECSSHLLCDGSLKTITKLFYLSPLTSFQTSTPLQKSNLVSDSPSHTADLNYRSVHLDLEGDEWPSSLAASPSISTEQNVGYVPVSLDALVKRKISYPFQASNANSSVIQSTNLVTIQNELFLLPDITDNGHIWKLWLRQTGLKFEKQETCRILLVELLGRQPNEDGGRDYKRNIQMDYIQKAVRMEGRQNWIWVMSHGKLWY